MNSISFHVVAILSTACWLVTLRPTIAQPANDDFENRIVIEGSNVVVTGNNTGATVEDGEFVKNGVNWRTAQRSVWWSWTAPADGASVVSTAGSGFEAQFGVGTGSEVNDLTPVASRIPGASAFPRAVFQVEAGVEYQIAVGTHSSTPNFPEEGEIVLSVQFFPKPMNDDFAGRISLEGEHVEVQMSLMGATWKRSEEGRVEHSDPGVWWSWTAPESGAVTVTVGGLWSSEDELLFDSAGTRSALGVYLGVDLESLEVVGSGHSTGQQGAPWSRVTYEASAGTTYQIGVSGIHGVDGGMVLNIGYGDPPRVIVASPSLSARFTAPATVVTHAEAANEAGEAARVDFLIGSLTDSRKVLHVVDDQPPFTLTWSDIPPGSYVAVAQAMSDRGARGDAVTVPFEVLPANDDFADRLELSGAQPVVTATLGHATREAGELWTFAPGTVWWSWEAPDSGEYTASVVGPDVDQWRIGGPDIGVFEGTSLSALVLAGDAESIEAFPLHRSQVVWNAVGGRQYELGVAAPWFEEVEISILRGRPPEVTLTSPTAGIEVEVPATLRMSADVSDEDGEIDRVEFYDAGKLLGIVHNAPFEMDAAFTYAWDRLELRAVAFDGTGLAGSSEAVEAWVRPASPSNDDFESRIVLSGVPVDERMNLDQSTLEPGEPDFGAGGSAWWTWTAPADGEFTASLQFDAYEGSTARAVAVFVGEELENLDVVGADFVGGTVPWPPFGLARVTFMAEEGGTFVVAGYGDGGSRLRVLAGRPPQVSLTAPAPGSRVLVGQPVNLEAAATDADGEVVSVEFYAGSGGQSIGVATGPPFSLETVFTNDSSQTMMIAVATDSQGLQSRSDVVQIEVMQAGPGNDHFADRFVLSGSMVITNGSGGFSTLEPDEPQHPGGSVWWSWTAPESRGYTFVFEGDPAPAVVVFYRGEELSLLEPVESSSSQGLSSMETKQVSIEAEAGVVYEIAVIGYRDYTLRLVPSVPPSVTLLEPSDYTRVSAGETILLRAEAADADGDLDRVEFHRSWSGGLIDREEDPPLERVKAPIAETNGMHTVYAVAVDAHGLEAVSRVATLHVLAPAPDNDLFENRTVKEGRLVWAEGRVVSSTLEPGESWSLGSESTGSVWWSWTAPANGLVVVTLEHPCCGNVEMGVFEGQTIEELESVVQRMPSTGTPGVQFSFTAVAGREYQIGFATSVSFLGNASNVQWSLLLLPMEWSAFRREADGSFVLVLRAGDEAGWRVDVSNDLREWSTLREAVVVNGELEIQDPAAAAEHQRFYRAVPMWGVE